MRIIAFLMAVVISTPAFAQTVSEPTALNSGKPAGVQRAQMTEFDNPIIIAIGVAAIAAGIAIAASGHSHHAAAGGSTTTTTTTTTTSTSP